MMMTVKVFDPAPGHNEHNALPAQIQSPGRRFGAIARLLSDC
jgi:hypothetical protein